MALSDSLMALSEKQRMKRVRQVWLAAGPSGFEVAAARKRYFAEQSAAQGTGFRWAIDLAWGFCAVAALIVGYEVWTGDDERVLRDSVAQEARPAPVATDSVSGSASGLTSADSLGQQAMNEPLGVGTSGLIIADPSQASLEIGGSKVLIAPGVRYEVAAGERAIVSFGAERSIVAGPQLIEFTFEADRASGFVMHLSELSQAPAKVSEAPEQPATEKLTTPRNRPDSAVDLSSSQATSWTKVARAMRDGDQSTAERELQQLSRAGSTENRDSAALALAQLWLARGEVARARPALGKLQRDAVSPVVKRRASELFEGLPAD
jgi:hypothetical protein